MVEAEWLQLCAACTVHAKVLVHLLQYAKKGRDFPGLVEAVQCSMHIHGSMHEACTS